MRKITRIALFIACTLTFLGVPNKAGATHLMGGQISYTHVSGNTYTIRLSLYRDCDGIALASTNTVNVTAPGFSTSITVSRVAINDVSLLCPGQTSECNGGTTPGIQEHVYQGNVTLNNPALYTITFSNCCRNNSITTLVNPGNQNIYLTAQLNTAIAAGNSSPQFLSLPVGQFCTGSLNSISPNGSDANGDVIQYSLINALEGLNNPVNYAAGFSGLNPLTSSTGVTINPNTGEITFTPSAQNTQVAVIAFKAEEFRVINGVSTKIGEVIREVQVKFVGCSGNAAPVLTPIANVIVQVGQNYCVNVSATDDPGQTIALNVVSAIAPPATLTVTGSGGGFTNGQFCFTPQAVHQGNTYTVSINAQDNFCPTPSTAVRTFNITVPPPCNVSINTSSTDATCGATDGTATATLTGGTGNLQYSWTGPNGFTSIVGPTITGLAAGTYNVNIVDGFQCAEQATIIVGVAPTVQLSAMITNTTCGGYNGSIDASASSGTPPYAYSLNGATPQNTGLFSNLSPGSYTVSVSDGTGCTVSQQYNVGADADVLPPTINGVPANTSASCEAVPPAALVSASDNCSTSVPVVLTEAITPGNATANGLRGIWWFDEGSGSNSVDQSGNASTATLSPNVSWTSGYTGKAMEFPGTANDYVAIPNGTGGDLDTRYSLSMFARFIPGSNGSSQMPIIQFNENGWGCHLWQTGPNQLFVRFTMRGSLAFTTHLAANVLVPNQWNSVGATYDYATGVAKLWHNGVAVQTLFIGQMELSTNYPVRIGSVNFDGRRTNGRVDNVMIFDRALTNTEVGQIAAASCPNNYTLTRTWTATDIAGNKASASQVITVEDNIAPIISCPANITVGNALGQCGANVTFSASATDNCNGDVTISYSIAPGSFFPIGTTTVIATATDVCGNSSTCTLDVVVTDNELPAITCPPTANLTTDPGQCSSSASIGIATATDNCTGVVVSGPVPAGPYPIGTTQVTWTATDASNNVVTCTQDVVVTDGENPVVSCPAAISEVNDAGQCGAIVTFAATATDNCPGVTVVSVPASGSFFPVGVTTVTTTATDAANNVDVCTFTVTVNDTEDPVIACTPSFEVCEGDVVTYTLPTATDNCTVSSVLQTDASGYTNGDVFPVGTTTIEYTATDANNNTSICSFDVIVHALPSVAIVQTEQDQYCQGGAYVLTADAPDAVSYNWSNGSTDATTEVTASGTYALTVTNQYGCQNTTSVVVNYVPQNLLSGYTIIAEEDVHLHENNTVLNGGVGVLDANKSAKIHKNSTITAPTTFVMAGNIDVKDGSVVATQIIGQPSVTLPTFLYATPGTLSVTVPDNTTMVLTGTEYKKVDVKKNATVIFTQNDVHLKELHCHDGATIEFSGCSFLRIQKKLDLHKNNTFNPQGYRVNVFIEDEKADLKEGNIFNGSIYALDEEIKVKGKDNNPSYMNGMFIGKKIKGEKNVTWNWNTDCGTNCPIPPAAKSGPSNLATSDDLGIEVIAYPSPFSSTFNVEITSDYDDNVEIALFDMNGKLLELYENVNLYDTPTMGANLPAGMYFVSVNQNGITKVVKISKM